MKRGAVGLALVTAGRLLWQSIRPADSTEPAKAALAWAWEHVDTDHIISLIQPDNLASIRIAIKLGERFERVETLYGEAVHVYGIRRLTTDRT